MDNLLISSVLNKDIETLQDMLDKNLHKFTKEDMLHASLHTASINAKNIVDLFLSKEIHTNDVLAKAVKHSFKSAIDILLQMDGDINHEHNGQTLITLAIIPYDTECVTKLLDHGAQLNLKTKEGETCLTCIPQHLNDYTQEIQYLVAKGANVNLPNEKGDTPLHVAANFTNVPTLCTLLSIGAQVNSQNSNGETALMIASKKYNSQCVLLLLEFGAEKDVQSLRGDTALMNCIKSTTYHEESSYKIIDLLLQNGCKTDIADNKGQIPLFLPIQKNESDIISKLLLFGADIVTEDNHGMTPFLASIITRYDELASYLIDMECHVSGCLVGNQDWKYDSSIVGLIATALSPGFNKLNCGLLNKLFFEAGETIPIKRIYQPDIIPIMATETQHKTLMKITRHAIRTYLSTLSSINLIAQISKLPLPISLKKYLYFL